MSMKRNQAAGRASSSSDAGAKIERQALFDQLQKYAAAEQVFTPVDVALAIGAGEAQVSRALLGLAAEGNVEKVEAGKYRAAGGFSDLSMGEFLKVFVRASRTDGVRQRDLSEIGRLKQNNDIMRSRLLTAIAERDHYLAILRRHGIDPGPPPAIASEPGVGSAAADAAATDSAAS
jgi:hypothetical protein